MRIVRCYVHLRVFAGEARVNADLAVAVWFGAHVWVVCVAVRAVALAHADVCYRLGVSRLNSLRWMCVMQVVQRRMCRITVSVLQVQGVYVSVVSQIGHQVMHMQFMALVGLLACVGSGTVCRRALV